MILIKKWLKQDLIQKHLKNLKHMHKIDISNKTLSKIYQLQIIKSYKLLKIHKNSKNL